jgi:hypothetical protein
MPGFSIQENTNYNDIGWQGVLLIQCKYILICQTLLNPVEYLVNS